MTTERATLAKAEEDLLEDDSDDDDDDEEAGNHEAVACAFDVPHFRYIDDDETDGWSDGSGWRSSEEDSYPSWSYRYVVVSGTPLKILEHLLSDLRLDDQRGAPESTESGKF